MPIGGIRIPASYLLTPLIATHPGPQSHKEGPFMLQRTCQRIFLVGRRFHVSSSASQELKTEKMAEPKEIKIPVPFGHIAGKIWNEGGIPLLGLHGWMDNAGTWDAVAPLLPKSISLVAIDFPGHGHSSHSPMGIGSVFMNLLVDIERVVQHFEWKEVNLLGHSMGGAAAMLYSSTFPEKVKKLVVVDLIKPLATPADKQPQRTARSIKELLEVETKFERDPQCYEFHSIVDKLVKGYDSSITEEAAKVLLKRGSVKYPNGLYSFSHDPRLKIPNLLGMTFDQQKEFANRLNCELMIIKASSGPFYESKEDYDEILKIYEKKAKTFVYKMVEGTHHVHMNNPDIIAPLIGQFIEDSACDT